MQPSSLPSYALSSVGSGNTKASLGLLACRLSCIHLAAIGLICILHAANLFGWQRGLIMFVVFGQFLVMDAQVGRVLASRMRRMIVVGPCCFLRIIHS